jgi:hypothetical protein
MPPVLSCASCQEGAIAGVTVALSWIAEYAMASITIALHYHGLGNVHIADDLADGYHEVDIHV